jgi:serine/threonine protein kinase
MSFGLKCDEKAGKILGDRYYLHDLIAQTNYSRVFLASDLAINHRKCAIKQFYPSYYPATAQSKIKSEFLHEVEISQKVSGQHTQICQYYNYLIDSGNQYLVQEWIEGTTLEQKLCQQSKFSESETKNILSRILLVLKHIHDLEVVHNDLKPGNIILRFIDNFPVLIDFGIARNINSEYEPKTIVGTPGYMSLEQAMGKVSFENDLYSLGMTAIHLLTGKTPQSIDFEENNFWNQEKLAFDPRLVATIDKAISPRPTQRFSAAMQMLSMLQSSSSNLVLMNQMNIDKIQPRLPYLSSIVILALSGIWLYLNYLISLPDSQSPLKIIDPVENRFVTSLLLEDEVKPTILETKQKALQKVIFPPGTLENKVLGTLGEPLWRKPGFWANSVAWSYKNIISEGFDFGYIFDRQTNKLRQVEIAVPPTTELSTVQLALESFLVPEQSTIDIERGLQAVEQRKQATYNFTIGNLEGIIQRNDQDRIYIAVWSADFH